MANEPRKIDELSETEKKAIIIQALNKDGYNDNQASKLINVSRARVSQVNKKARSGVLTPLVHKAKKSIGLLVEGKTVGDMKDIKGSDVIAAAKMVMDRAEPIISKVESSNTNTFVYGQINEGDRQKYMKLLGIVDAEFEVVEQKQLEHKDEK